MKGRGSGDKELILGKNASWLLQDYFPLGDGRESVLQIFFFFFFCFLGLNPQDMEASRLGVELELQLPTYATATATHDLNLHHSSPQFQIPNLLSKAWDQTRNLMVSGQIVSAVPLWELLLCRLPN